MSEHGRKKEWRIALDIERERKGLSLINSPFELLAFSGHEL